jgi:dienelactone hydrolase
MHPALDPTIQTIQVRDGGLVGTFYLPGTAPPWPAVVVVGGSSPGIFGLPGSMFASSGIASLALAYFGMPGLPKTFERIPLEYFKLALDWLAHRADVRQDAIAVAGASRGGELALLLAATYPQFRAVVSWVGSGLALRAHSHPHVVEHLVYEGAGHIIGPPVPGLSFSMTHAVHPLLGVDFAFGGTVEKNTAASHDSWPRVVAFLQGALS